MSDTSKDSESPQPIEDGAPGARGLSRRGFVKAGVGGTGILGAAALGISTGGFAQGPKPASGSAYSAAGPHAMHLMPTVVGEVNHGKNGFNPTDLLEDFDTGAVSMLATGQTLREFTLIAQNKIIEIVPGMEFQAWTYNGRVPGPTIRVNEGDRVRITLQNASDHPHSIHFHGVHPGLVDGVFDMASGVVQPGGKHTYEFDAEPFGLHLYHCHTAPLAKHIAKGLYGTFIIDPKGGRPAVDREMVMVMAGYDTDFDGANDFYLVNGIPFHYDHGKHPIQLRVGEKVRIYLVNVLEYDISNSFHLHANFFQYYPTGTSLTPSEFTDTVALMQGQRGILEFNFKHPGRYMFHAHKTEFAELGWTGVFEVRA